jgi:hypothetical protein
MLGIYQNWGFRANPFETRPLPANEEGEQLLIGRRVEVDKIVRRIMTPNKIITVEGSNGIGKTSINNVASYVAYRSFLNGESDQLLVPCEKAFQLRADSKIDEFVEHVFLYVGLTLVKYADLLTHSGRGHQTEGAIAAWLTSPVLQTIRGSLSIYGVGGVGIGSGISANTSTGFSRAGFNDLIRTWLAEIFPNSEGGSIICTIDNLELLRESEAARTSLEALRDEILNMQGLRWIICGSTGIVRTLASTPRLHGYLHAPIEIGDIDHNISGSILRSRAEAYRIRDDAYLPLTPSDFASLYSVLKGNIRDSLSEADNFCNWVADEGVEYIDEKARHEQFNVWLHRECSERLSAAESVMSARPWQLFDDIINSGGQCSPGAFKDFGFETPQAMRFQVLTLEAANLVKSVRNEEDNRRKTILVTSSGWMVEFAKQNSPGPLFPRSIPSAQVDTQGMKPGRD